MNRRDVIGAVGFTRPITDHHEVELTVGRADGLKHEGYLAELVVVESGQRGWYPDRKQRLRETRPLTPLSCQRDLLEPRHVEREDEVVVVGAASSTANVVASDLPT